ncbi:BAHD acyltransferase At5g47980-like [Prunus avium]|uniref:BAHD acyltransferase At5g47980-like n=2 Tax=Prunus avium TaxID=42229 RepID=A0A6P5U0V1_PRUAV|nr:BAHD acyltransferase At5g47980-like [Prunus avium]
MAQEMKIEIVKKETIKPSAPTPHNLKSFKLSLLDQLVPVVYGPMVLFYPSNVSEVTLTEERSHQLKKSLSEALTRFYPLAGRIKDNLFIECNDEGAVYVEARVNALLSNFLDQPNLEILKLLLPIKVESPEAGTGCLLLVQASFFECGGLAIGVCMSHKLADASTLSTFIKVWAATALGLGHTVVPDFSAATRYPPGDFSAQSPAAAVEMKIVKCVTKRFVFDGPKMRALKAKVTSGSVQRPTRVEAVTGLIWNCARKASKLSSGISKLSMVSQSVNIRKRVVPQFPQTSIGNLVGYYTAMAEVSGIELNSMELVSRLRKGMVEFNENHPKRLQGDNVFEAICEYFKEIGNIMGRDDINLFTFTSLCNFGIYEIDFGWGKPIWVNIPIGVVQNLVLLIDTKEGDGVDALVSLSEEDMALFERDPELLAFASLNPCVFGPVTRRSSL